MSKVWRYSPHDESEIRRLSTHLRVSPLMAQVLISRGYSGGQQAADFLNARLTDLHDPELLPGVTVAVDRIVAAVKDARRITIYGDYDVDGVTATSLLWHCLKLAGANVDYYIPSRLEEGYGLNEQSLRQMHADDPRRIIVTVDCGISAVAEAAVARELGLELIITDHHTFGDSLPEAACLVHPRLAEGNYPFGDLCGVGVAFKLAWGICQRLGDGKKASPRMREFLKSAVGLAAIGTVADVVPLLGENRVIVRYGLSSLRERSTPGMQALMRVSGVADKKELQAEDIAFAIAPRLNAAGRLGQARLAVELLTTENEERAKSLADYLDQLNNNRRTVERKILKQAKELVAEKPHWEEHCALVLSHHEWHAGVIGIVASRVAEHFQKPVVLISMDGETSLGQGSGRTFAGCDLFAALSACSEHLERFGGHQAAAGLKIHAGKVDVFRDAFCRACGELGDAAPGSFEMRIDAEVRLADVTRTAVGELDRLGPFGQNNPRPLFSATRVELAEPPRKIGEGERHLSLKVRQYGSTMRAVAFGKGEWADKIVQARGPISITFAPGINHYRGRESVELQLKDWRVEGTA